MSNRMKATLSLIVFFALINITASLAFQPMDYKVTHEIKLCELLTAYVLVETLDLDGLSKLIAETEATEQKVFKIIYKQSLNNCTLVEFGLHFVDNSSDDKNSMNIALLDRAVKNKCQLQLVPLAKRLTPKLLSDYCKRLTTNNQFNDAWYLLLMLNNNHELLDSYDQRYKYVLWMRKVLGQESQG